MAFIASWWTTAAAALTLCTVYLVYSFGENAYAHWIVFLYHTPLGVLFSLVLVANLSAASAGIIHARLRQRNLSAADIRAMDSYVEFHADDQGLQSVTSWMKNKGFIPRTHAGSALAVKGRFSFVPGTVLRAGLILLLLSCLASAYLRRSGEAILHNGSPWTFAQSTIVLKSIEPHLPDNFLQVGEEGTFKLDHVTAVVSSSGTPRVITPRSPARIDGVYYRITHIGYVQPMSITITGTTFEKNLDLDILPPGKTEILPLPGTASFMSISLAPERTITKGLLIGKQFNLNMPRYQLALQSGARDSKPVIHLVKPLERTTSKGSTISLGKNALYIKVQAVHDPALPWIYTGLLATLVGTALMISRFFWYWTEVAVVCSGEYLLIGYRDEFYSKWGVHKFQEWKEDLAALFTGGG